MKVRKFLIYILICVIFSIFDYYMCDLVAYQLKLPLFCDMIFCMAMSLFAGPVWGIVVVCFNHIYDLIISKSFVIFHIYMITAFAGCFVVWFYRNRFIKADLSLIKKLGHLLLLSLIMCLVMSITGGLVSRFIDLVKGEVNNYTYQTDFLQKIFSVQIKSPLLNSIFVRIPVNLVDRIITVFAAWGVFNLMKFIEKQITARNQKEI